MKFSTITIDVPDISTDSTSVDIDATYMIACSVHAVINGTASSLTLSLNGTDQGPELSPAIEGFLGVPYVYNELATSSISATGSYLIPYTDITCNKIQVSLAPAPETVTVTTIADVAGSLAGCYFLISVAPGGSPPVDLYIWFEIGGVGSNPAIPDRTGIQVIAATNASANTLASTIASTITGVAPSAFASVSAVGNVVTFVQNQLGSSGLADGTPPLDTGFTFDTPPANSGTAQIYLQGLYF